MQAARALLFLLYQCIVTPCYAAVMVLLFWIPRVPMYRIAASWCHTNLRGARWICGIRHRVVGAENIPATPHIVMSKHSSTWETLALTLFFPPLAYVAKKELLSIPFFGWGFALASPITIDRKAGTDSMQQIAAQGRARFEQGFWIVIYPEGTRIRAGTRAKYKTGGARLAIELATPILPVAHNAGYIWPKGLFGKRPGTVTISIGRPISPLGKDVPTLMREVETWIEDEVARLGIPRVMARLRLKDIFGGRADDGRSAEGETRRIKLAGASVDYRLVRARRRSIGMQIDFSGLTVRAPRWVSRREIDETLAERGAWILRSLDEWRARRRDVLPREWKTGAPILYRGRELALDLRVAPERGVTVDLLNLTVRHPAARDDGEIATFVTHWLRDEAARLVLPRVAEYAARVTPAAPVVKLSNGRSEWGSCDQKGVIRLNWRLIHLPPHLALYIVAHEVAHLVELNHSARFWALVEGLFPESAAARRTLDDWTALLEA